jgi:hypothetical protein
MYGSDWEHQIRQKVFGFAERYGENAKMPPNKSSGGIFRKKLGGKTA